MKSSVFIIFIFVVNVFSQYVPSISYNGLEVITARFFTFARSFNYDPVSKYLYLLAENETYHQDIYLVDTETFVAYEDVVAYDTDFSSYFVGTVNVSGIGGQFFAIGTRNRGESDSASQALSIVIIDEVKQSVIEIPGFNLWSLYVDIISDPINSTIYAFFAGYIPIQVNNQTGVQLSVVRMKVTLGNNLNVSFDVGKDIVTLRTTGYQAFSPTFKPWIFRDKTVNSLFVVVPGNDAAIFDIQVMPDPSIPLQLVGFQDILTPLDAVYDVFNGILYLAYSGTPGWIDAYNNDVNVVYKYTLEPQELTPFPLALDENANLYITLSDPGYIVALASLDDYRLGIQMIPPSMKNVQSAFAKGEYSYYISSTEVSSVFRIKLTNFCQTTCYGGYCDGGTCKCEPGYQFKNSICTPSEENSPIYIVEKRNGTIGALAFFFVVSLLLAVAGWGMLLRFKFFNPQRSRYVAL